MLRDAAVVAAVAVLTVQALRRWFGDRYMVPSGSMQPLLYGDPVNGDIVFVRTRASAAGLRRGDVVVVKDLERPDHQLVKRIAACGDEKDFCCINIIKGDIWLGPNRQLMQREVKDPLEARQQRILWADSGGDSRSDLLDMSAARRPVTGSVADGTCWLPAGVGSVADARTTFRPRALLARRVRKTSNPLPENFLGTGRPLDATYVDVIGSRSTNGDDVAVTDGCMEIVLAQPANAEVLATIEMPGEALTFHWQPSTGRVQLWRNGVDVAETSFEIAAASVIEFGRLDDRAWFCVDRSRRSLFIVPRRSDWQEDPKSGLPVGPRALLHLGVIGADSDGLAIAALRVYRDIYAARLADPSLPGQPGGWPRVVPPGHWFLLGDNAFESRDSRQFGSVPIQAFLGVPVGVLGPWSRRRWL